MSVQYLAGRLVIGRYDDPFVSYYLTSQTDIMCVTDQYLVLLFKGIYQTVHPAVTSVSAVVFSLITALSSEITSFSLSMTGSVARAISLTTSLSVFQSCSSSAMRAMERIALMFSRI